MPVVLNLRTLREEGHKKLPDNAAYVGRPTKWGNPYVLDQDGDRLEVVDMYTDYIMDSPLLESVSELRGKDLVCWCAPLPCHADVLLQLANVEGD